MTDRVCVRGCTQRDVHYATCSAYGVDLAKVPEEMRPHMCKGCAPVECRDGSMVCDRCFGRMRRFISDAPDLLGRLRSLADPSKALPVERGRGGRAVQAPAPVPADLIDAAEDVMRTLRSWAVSIDRDLLGGGIPAGAGAAFAYELAHQCAQVIVTELPRIANRRDDVLALGAAVLDVHPADEHGERPFWSIVDAVARYRMERPDDRHPWVDVVDDEELLVAGVPEWEDPLISRPEAERLAGSPSTLRRWLKAEHLAIVGRIFVAGVQVQMLRRSDVLEVRDRMVGRQGESRFGGGS